MKNNKRVTMLDLVDGNLLDIDGVLCRVELKEDGLCEGCAFDSKYGCKTSSKCYSLFGDFIFVEVKDNE